MHRLTLKSASGDTITTRQLQFPAGSQIARFIDEARFFGGMVADPLHPFVKIDASIERAIAMGMLLTG